MTGRRWLFVVTVLLGSATVAPVRAVDSGCPNTKVAPGFLITHECVDDDGDGFPHCIKEYTEDTCVSDPNNACFVWAMSRYYYYRCYQSFGAGGVLLNQYCAWDEPYGQPTGTALWGWTFPCAP